jgi:hypothetical protein
VKAYLRPMRRELVRIAGIADAGERQAAFRRFWDARGRFHPKLRVPRSLRKGYSAPRTWAEPFYRRAYLRREL